MIDRQKQLTGIIGIPDFNAFARERLRKQMNLEDGNEAPADLVQKECERLADVVRSFEKSLKKTGVRYCIEFNLPYSCRLVDSKRAVHQHYSPMEFKDHALEIIRLAESGVNQARFAADLLAYNDDFANLRDQVKKGEIQLSERPLSFRKMDGIQRRNNSMVKWLDDVAWLTGNIMVDNDDLQNFNPYDEPPKIAQRFERITRSLLIGYEQAMRDMKILREDLVRDQTDNYQLLRASEALVQAAAVQSNGTVQVDINALNRLIKSINAAGDKEILEIAVQEAQSIVQDNTENPHPVKAEAYSDDHKVELKFDAAPWFEQADDQQIIDLAKCGYGGDYPADAVVEYMDDYGHLEAKRMFAHVGTTDESFKCHIDEDSAKAWIQANRPELFATMNAEDGQDVEDSRMSA